MNIVFISAPSTRKVLPKEYQTIVDGVKKLRHSIHVDFVKFRSRLKDDPEKKFKKVLEEIKKADAVIAEATSLTVDTSRLISIAVQNHIPTLVLYREQSPQSYVFESSRLLSLEKYSSRTILDVLRRHLKKINKKKLTYRFNLMLSKDLGSYVTSKSRKHLISKADYIRTLIIRDMKTT